MSVAGTATGKWPLLSAFVSFVNDLLSSPSLSFLLFVEWVDTMSFSSSEPVHLSPSLLMGVEMELASLPRLLVSKIAKTFMMRPPELELFVVGCVSRKEVGSRRFEQGCGTRTEIVSRLLE